MTISAERVHPVSYRSGVFEVTGSKGDIHIVNRGCDCPGFRYRRNCCHVELVAAYQKEHQVELESDFQRRIEELFK
jgi:hypothetical protein